MDPSGTALLRARPAMAVQRRMIMPLKPIMAKEKAKKVKEKAAKASIKVSGPKAKAKEKTPKEKEKGKTYYFSLIIYSDLLKLDLRFQHY